MTVRAPIVVVACGALESPALLKRSGIGGPAVGNYLRLHPTAAMLGLYGEDQEPWLGAPQAGLVDEFADINDGYGFLVEGVQFTPGLTGSALPWTSAEEHKELFANARRGASFVNLTRDHGHGRVDVDKNGEPVPYYDVSDPTTISSLHAGIETCARLHHAAGAVQMLFLANSLPMWRIGDDIEAFIERCHRQPLRAGGVKLFSAHQMGTCRMGSDPQTSVANPWGELHDTPGVWIGDGSAFPTPSGTNPMISIMGLAHRTAEAIAGTRIEAKDTAVAAS